MQCLLPNNLTLRDRDDKDGVEEIPSMPEVFRYGVNCVVEALQPVVARGLKAVLLFGVPSKLPKVNMHTVWCSVSI